MALRAAEADREQAERVAVEARLASLESHLEPHFLFNTLNSIVALAGKDPARVERLAEDLADLLRACLGATRQHRVALSEELELCAAYLEIESARLGARLRHTLDVPAELGACRVPALALLTLVQNAVRHAIAEREEGGALAIEARREGAGLVLAVWDDGPAFSLAQSEVGHGLDNLRARLAAFYGAEGALEVVAAEGGKRVVVRIPAGPAS